MVRGADDKTIAWNASFASCGGKGAMQSSTIVYEIEPGGHLGWHTDATEETQYIIAGTGELKMEDGSDRGGPGSVFVLPTMCATTSPIPARRRCGRSRSSPRRCSRRTSTT